MRGKVQGGHFCQAGILSHIPVTRTRSERAQRKVWSWISRLGKLELVERGFGMDAERRVRAAESRLRRIWQGNEWWKERERELHWSGVMSQGRWRRGWDGYQYGR